MCAQIWASMAVCLLWPLNRAGHSLLVLWFLFLSFPFFLAYSQRSQIGCLTYFHTWCSLSANLECRCTITAKTRNPLKFAGVPETGKPMSDANEPKFTILREPLFNKFFLIVDICLRCEDIARQCVWWCADGEFSAIFCVLYYQLAACSMFQTCILNSH